MENKTSYLAAKIDGLDLTLQVIQRELTHIKNAKTDRINNADQRVLQGAYNLAKREVDCILQLDHEVYLLNKINSAIIVEREKLTL